jgi:drug/metabolite transporter (DMT)-like permease
MSSGVAYTLQIIGQKHVKPVIASMIMSLEAVFSLLAGFVILGDKLTERELLGCALVLIAIILAQLPDKSRVQ